MTFFADHFVYMGVLFLKKLNTSDRSEGIGALGLFR